MPTGVAIMSGGVPAMRGGGALAAAAGTSCCCGAAPCRCEANPGCESASLRSFHVSRTSVLGPANYRFGPYTADCCCKPSSGGTSHYSFLVVTFFGPGTCAGYPSRSVEVTGTGTTTAVDFTVTLREFVPGSGSCALSNVQTYVYHLALPEASSRCLLSFAYTPAEWVPGLAPFALVTPDTDFSNGSRNVGYVHQECNFHDANWRSFRADGTVASLIQYRHEISPDRASCVTPTCRACCLPDGSCVLTNPENCTALGGAVQTTTDCSPCDLLAQSLTGRCCLPDGSCRNLTRNRCVAAGGSWDGLGTSCELLGQCPQPTTHACCLPNGLCIETMQLDCQQQGGTWYPNNHCGDPGVCPPPPTGACCTLSGSGAQCTVTTLDQCIGANGYWQGPGTDCSNPNATCLGACCSPSQFCASGRRCSDNVGQAFCQSIGGTFLGGGTFCQGGGDCDDPRCVVGFRVFNTRVAGSRGFF